MNKKILTYVLLVIVVLAAAAFMYFDTPSNQSKTAFQSKNSPTDMASPSPINISTTSTSSHASVSTSTEVNGELDRFEGKVLKIEGNNLYEVQVLETVGSNPKGVIILKDTTSNSNYPLVLSKEYAFATSYNLSQNWYVIEKADGGGPLPPSFE